MKKLSALFISLAFIISGFAQKVNPGIIYWNEARQLTTDDFTVVSDTSARMSDNHLALTRTGITYELTSKPQSKTFEIRIYATMHKANSFLKQRVLEAPPGSIRYLINHEQKHFDISEIFAREAVKAIRGKPFTKNYAKELNALMQNLFKQSEAMQDVYDTQTRNGADAVAQKEWNDRIYNRLQSLEAYKNKSVSARAY